MPSVSPLLHTAVRNTRRVRGRVKISSARVDGLAPTAVVTAIKQAAFGRPNAEERAWIKRIELMRALLLTSPAPSEIIDFGAGTAHQFDTGAALTKNTVTKTLGAMTTSSKPPRWAYLLFRLVRELRPQSVLEMGACVGISASYEAAALELNGAGRLLTLEGAEVLADRSAQTLGELNLGHRAEVRLGQFADTIEPASAELSPLGFAFIDGHHIESATLAYLEQLLPSMAGEAVFVFDDVNWSDGMRNAWSTIVDDPRIALTVDLRSVGIAVVSKSATGRHSLDVPYY
jgi:predicted O-methyltransferase YrrM